jgi:hypothetical protein
VLTGDLRGDRTPDTEADSGASFRVDNARIAEKPAMLSGVTLASAPPQIIASA